MVALLGLLLAPALSLAETAAPPPPPSPWYQYDATPFVGADFKLHWQIDGEFINVRLVAATDGWVGFGIGEPGMGSMKGSDLVYAWVDGGTVSVTDAFATVNGYPSTDAWQDWTATAHAATATTTDITLRRALAVAPGAEGEDRPIVDDGTRTKVQLAWGTADYMNGHSGTAQAASAVIDLFAGVAGELEMEAELAGQSHGFFEVAVRDYPGAFASGTGSGSTAGGAIPAAHTAYIDYCVPLTGPMEMNASLTGIAYKYGAGLRGYIHHVTLTGFLSADCSGDNMIFGLTTPAQGPMVLPPDVGFLLGQDPDGNLGFGSIAVQMHYDNPAGVAGLVDTSSVRIYHTEPGTLSPHRAGLVGLGDVSVQMMSLRHLYGDGTGELPVTPPGHSSKTTFYCDTSDWPQAVRVHEHLHHMHIGGDYLRTVHTDAAGGVVETETTEYYSFAHQDMIRMPSEGWTITPGDTFATSCYHKNSQAGDGVADEWGLGSNQEMCQDFLVVWPYVPGIPFKCQTNDVSNQTVVADPVRVFGRAAVGPQPTTAPPPPPPPAAPPPLMRVTLSGSLADLDGPMRAALISALQGDLEARSPGVAVSSIGLGSGSTPGSIVALVTFDAGTAAGDATAVLAEVQQAASGGAMRLDLGDGTTLQVLAASDGSNTAPGGDGDGGDGDGDGDGSIAIIAGAAAGGCVLVAAAAVAVYRTRQRRAGVRADSMRSARVSPADARRSSLRASQQIGESTEDLLTQMP